MAPIDWAIIGCFVVGLAANLIVMSVIYRRHLRQLKEAYRMRGMSIPRPLGGYHNEWFKFMPVKGDPEDILLVKRQLWLEIKKMAWRYMPASLSFLLAMIVLVFILDYHRHASYVEATRQKSVQTKHSEHR